ncbi:hypothetical protein SDC9_71507 [bioreactor metagenome]|uniref:Uncharacterized protein n=1 Tax=bioreactor metagenome TaxID=1076179 RepID=A0A644YAR2_9ZZZZ
MDIKTVLVLAIIFGGIEALICNVFKKKFAKFILPIALLVISLVLFSIGKFVPLEGMKDLAYMVTGMLAGISSAISFVVALICMSLNKGGEK